MITAVVTVHRDTRKLLSTLASLEACPNITRVVITATGFHGKEWKIKNLPSKYYKVINPNGYSNAAWIAGVAAAPTPLVVLLHDGDILSPTFGQQKFKLGHATHYQAFNITAPWIHKELCVNNMPSSKADMLRMLSGHNTKTLSPGRGVFPKEHILNALTEFEQWATNSLIVNESLLVGNDWYLWWKLANSSIPLDVIELPLIGFDIEDSTTVRSDRGTHLLERIYNQTRRRIGVVDTSKDSFCNVLYEGLGRLDKTTFLAVERRSIPRVYFSALNYQPLAEGGNQFGTAAFLTALEYCHSNGYQYMLYTEDDCRIIDQAYDFAMVSEFLANRTPEHKLYGTPIFWNVRNLGRYYFKRYLEYVNCCPLITMIQGSLHPSERPSMYPNGALCIYDCRFLYPLLISQARSGIQGMVPWDLHIGNIITDHYREDVFDLIMPSSCTYSDGGFSIIPMAARNQNNYPEVLAWHK